MKLTIIKIHSEMTQFGWWKETFTFIDSDGVHQTLSHTQWITLVKNYGLRNTTHRNYPSSNSIATGDIEIAYEEVSYENCPWFGE